MDVPDMKDLDVGAILVPPAIANVYKLNPECGRCSAAATCAMVSIGGSDADDPMMLSLLTLCEPCAQKIVATLDISHEKVGVTWVCKDADDIARAPSPKVEA